MSKDDQGQVRVSTTPPKTKEALLGLQKPAFEDMDRDVVLKIISGYVVSPGHKASGQRRSSSAINVGQLELGDLVLEIEPGFQVHMPLLSRWRDRIGSGRAFVHSTVDSAIQVAVDGFPVEDQKYPDRKGEVQKLPVDVTAVDEMWSECSYPHVVLVAAMGMIAKTAARKADATCLLVDVIVQVVTDVCLAVKGLLQVPRPCDSWGHYGKHVPALVPVPAFTAYPGGHAAVMAALLWFVADVTGAKPDEVDKLSLLGARIAGNRESAGLHIPSDTAAGWALGTHVARCLREMAKPGGQYKNWNAVFEAACSEW